MRYTDDPTYGGAAPSAPVAPSGGGAFGFSPDPQSLMLEEGHPYFNGGIKPLHWALGNEIAKQVQNRGLVDDLMNGAMMGMSPEQKVQADKEAAVRMKMEKIASETAHLDDTEFNKMADELAREVNAPAKAPQHADSPMGWAESLLAAGSAFAFPQYATSIAEGALKGHAAQDDQAYKDAMVQFEADQTARAQRIMLKREQLGQAGSRSLARVESDQQSQKLRYGAAASELDSLEKDRMNRDDNATRETIAKIQAAAKKDVAVINGKNVTLKDAMKAFETAKTVEQRSTARDLLMTAFGIPPEVLPAAANQGVDEKLMAKRSSELDDRMKLRRQKFEQLDLPLGKIKVKLSTERLAQMEKLTSYMDEDHAQKIAKGAAAIDNLNSMISNREFAQQIASGKFDLSVLQAHAKVVKEGRDGLHDANVELLKEIEGLQTDLMLASDDAAKTEISNHIKDLTDSVQTNRQLSAGMLGQLQAAGQKIEMMKAPHTPGNFVSGDVNQVGITAIPGVGPALGAAETASRSASGSSSGSRTNKTAKAKTGGGGKYSSDQISEARSSIAAMPEGEAKNAAIKAFEKRTGAKF